MKQQTKSKIDRSFDGLRNVLFEQLDALVTGKGKPEIANSVARVAGEITKSVSVQADLLRLASSKALKSYKLPGIGMK